METTTLEKHLCILIRQWLIANGFDPKRWGDKELLSFLRNSFKLREPRDAAGRPR